MNWVAGLGAVSVGSLPGFWIGLKGWSNLFQSATAFPIRKAKANVAAIPATNPITNVRSSK